MRLKTFHAKTMTEAMQMIREALGDEAVIVATNEDRVKGSGVRVTAAVDPAFEIGGGAASSESYDDGGWLQYDDENDIDAVAEELTEVMLRHCVPEDVMDNIISCATVMGFDDIRIALVTTLEQLFSFQPLPTRKYSKPLMMVGPPGSGKTLAAAKLAARSTMNGLSVGVISADTKRAGGIEQLRAFTDLLQIKLKKAEDYKALRSIANEERMRHDQVIIDTPGLNPFDKNEVKELARLMYAADVTPLLVLPAGVDADEAGEMARVFAAIGVKALLPTRIDMARRLGSLLSAAHYGDMSFTDASANTQVARGLTPLSPETLARMLTPRLYRDEKSDIVGHNYSSGPATTQARQKTGTR